MGKEERERMGIIIKKEEGDEKKERVVTESERKEGIRWKRNESKERDKKKEKEKIKMR